MRMERQRRRERVARFGRGAIAEPDFSEMKDGGEMARLELEGPLDVVQALLVPPQQVVERRALVPRLGVERRAAQERRQPGFSNVVASRGDIASRRFKDARCGAVRVIHPDAPDAVFGLQRLGGRAGTQAPEKLRQLGEIGGRTAATASGDQAEDLAHHEKLNGNRARMFRGSRAAPYGPPS